MKKFSEILDLPSNHNKVILEVNFNESDVSYDILINVKKICKQQ